MTTVVALGYDGVEEFFPVLLDLVKEKISGIPPVIVNRTVDTENSDAAVIRPPVNGLCTVEQTTAPLVIPVGPQSPLLFPAKWYFFPAVKSPIACGRLERPICDTATTVGVDQVVPIASFAAH